MSDTNNANTQLSLTPLGAGDLIDRAVRFYRKNFWTFVAIAAPPIFVGTFVSIFWGYLGRSLFNIGTSRDEVELSLYYVFLGLGSLLIWFVESIAILSVMGGASRNFVRHILFGEPITFRETYKNTKNRLGGLIVASAIIVILLVVTGYFILGLGMIVALLLIGLATSDFWRLVYLVNNCFGRFIADRYVFYALAFLSDRVAVRVCAAGDAGRRSGSFFGNRQKRVSGKRQCPKARRAVYFYDCRDLFGSRASLYSARLVCVGKRR